MVIGFILVLLLSSEFTAFAQLAPSQAPLELVESGGSSVPASFRPSIAVIVGVLTTMFSLTFLLLIYAKHCKRNPAGVLGSAGDHDVMPPQLLGMRRVSGGGIDAAVVEALPTFAFSSLRGNKDGLECAVCLCRYDEREQLRLLPKCKHAFHAHCVDVWLASHSTCPLCRHRVSADDLLIALSSRRSSSLDIDAAPHSRRSSLDLHTSAAFQIYVQRGPNAVAQQQQAEHDPEHQQQEEPSGEDWMSMRLGHRIIVSDVLLQGRWSDLVPSDVLFLSNAHTLFYPTNSGSSARAASTAKPTASVLKRALSLGRSDHHHHHLPPNINICTNSARVSQRCMSELSGLDRFSSKPGIQLLPFTYAQASAAAADATGSQDEEASTRWSRISRSTLNWLIRRH